MFTLDIINTGETAGEATLSDALPAGLTGESLDATFTLAAGESRRFELPATINEDAPALISNRATLRTVSGDAVATAEVNVVRDPALFSLSKRVTPELARVGDVVRFEITVINSGQTVGTAQLQDVLPPGLSGTDLNKRVTLNPGAVAVETLEAVVTEAAPEQVTNTATLSTNPAVGEGQTLSAEATLTVQRDPAVFTLDKSVEPTTASPGDTVTFTLTVTNAGEQAGSFNLTDTLPAGLTGDNLNASSLLDAGETRTFTLNATVNEDAPVTVTNTAQLTSETQTLNAAATLTVNLGEPLTLPQPEVVVTPQLPSFEQQRYSQVNLYYQTGDVMVCDLGTFDPGETKTIGVTYRLQDGAATVSRFNRSVNTAGVQAEPQPLSQNGLDYSYRVRLTNTSSAALDDVVLTEPLPPGADVQGASRVCQGGLNAPREILLTHTPPEGGTYDPGSSKLNGLSITDPYADAHGRLYFRVPYSEAARLSYLVQHTDTLPPVSEPTLTVKTDTRELFLVDNISFKALPLLVPSNAPLVTGSAGIEVRPVDAVADGRSPLVFDIRVFAESGEASELSYLTLASNLAFLDPDAEPTLTGYQVRLIDGRGELRLEPQATPTILELTLGYAEDAFDANGALLPDEVVIVEDALSVFIPSAQTGIYQYQASITLTTGGALNVYTSARAYAELPVAGGSLQVATDIGLDNAALDTDRGLRDDTDPTGRFPLTGAGGEAAPALRSDDGIAAKYSADNFSVGYYSDSLGVPAVSNLPRATALQAEGQFGPVEAEGFVGLLARQSVMLNIEPDGTRFYRLGSGVTPNSERLVVVSLTEKPLVKNRDYTINYVTGVISLAKPLLPTDEAFNPVLLRVSYAPEGAPRDQVALGAGASYRADNFSVSLGAAQVDTLKLGINAAYTGEKLNATLTYQAEFENTGTEFTGLGQISYVVSPSGTLALIHQTSTNQNETRLQYSQKLSDVFTVGGGAQYNWAQSTLSALGLVGLDFDPLTLQLSHAQPLLGDGQANSTLSAVYALNKNLSATAGVSYTWGGDLRTQVGLDQKIGDANFSVSYQLPTASGKGNQARFGVDVPFSINDSLGLDFFAFYDLAIATGDSRGAFGVTARYATSRFKASLGTEVALLANGDVKIVLRSGASGQLGLDQTLSFDANLQVAPEVDGSFTVAYALKLRDLNLLVYNRLYTGTQNLLEGEVAPTYYPNNSFQVRPNLAYRVNFDDAAATAYQASLFGTYLLDVQFGARDEDPTFIPYGNAYAPSFGVGAGVLHLAQPGAGQGKFGLAVEGNAQLLDPLWLTAGYLFDSDFGGLTSTTQGGFYVRLDVLGAGQY